MPASCLEVFALISTRYLLCEFIRPGDLAAITALQPITDLAYKQSSLH